MSDVKSVSTKGRNEISILFDVLGKKAKHNPPILTNAKISYDAQFLLLLLLLPFFPFSFLSPVFQTIANDFHHFYLSDIYK